MNSKERGFKTPLSAMTCNLKQGCAAHTMAPFRISGAVDVHLIFSGVFERHPRLTLAIVEFELAWAPHLLSTKFPFGIRPTPGTCSPRRPRAASRR